MTTNQQTWKEQQYAQSGKRDAQPYIQHDRCVEVPLERYRERTQAWIDNSPYEEEKRARIAYQEAFNAEIAQAEDELSLDEIAAIDAALSERTLGPFSTEELAQMVETWDAWRALQETPSYVEQQAAAFVAEPTPKPVKYIRFNVSRPSRPTWVHIASGKPFACELGRYGRWSSTLCGKEYEADDYTVIKDEAEAQKFLCKRCAQQKHLELRGADADFGFEKSFCK